MASEPKHPLLTEFLAVPLDAHSLEAHLSRAVGQQDAEGEPVRRSDTSTRPPCSSSGSPAAPPKLLHLGTVLKEYPPYQATPASGGRFQRGQCLPTYTP